jgi:hypothetical protein
MPHLKELSITREFLRLNPLLIYGMPEVSFERRNILSRLLTSASDRKNVDFSALEMTFTKAAVALPTVVGLRIQTPGEWDFLVKACPNTEVLVLWSNLHCVEMMEEVGNLQKLRHIEFFQKGWIESDIEDLYDWLPNVESLCLKGGVIGNIEVSMVIRNISWMITK